MSLLVRCYLCDKPCDPLSREVSQAAWGWEQKVKVRSSGKQGGSDIVNRRPFEGRFAHNECIQLEKSGVDPDQTSLVVEGVSD